MFMHSSLSQKPSSSVFRTFGAESLAGLSVFIEHHLPKTMLIAPPFPPDEKFEIYINVSGDVSFWVEDQLYPLQHGNLLIARPFEYHYRLDHMTFYIEYYRVLFSMENVHGLLNPFVCRQNARGNRLTFSSAKTAHLCTLCDQILADGSDAARCVLFQELLLMLQQGVSSDAESAPNIVPPELQQALAFIDREYVRPISVRQIAEECHISVSSLERHFRQYLSITPYTYLIKRRLSAACRLLRTTDKSITEIAEECQFPDCSSFIVHFRRNFNRTPSMYRKDPPTPVNEITSSLL